MTIALHLDDRKTESAGTALSRTSGTTRRVATHGVRRSPSQTVGAPGRIERPSVRALGERSAGRVAPDVRTLAPSPAPAPRTLPVPPAHRGVSTAPTSSRPADDVPTSVLVGIGVIVALVFFIAWVSGGII